MQRRQQSWPRQWLMTDERLAERLWEAIAHLPDTGGIVFRHYSLAAAARAELANRVADIARARGITLAVAGDIDLARGVGAALVHNPWAAASDLPTSRAVHDLGEAEKARSTGAALVFVSPVYPTRSHGGCKALGADQAAELAKAAGVSAIALGGMNAGKFAHLARSGFYGWAGIDAWLGA